MKFEKIDTEENSFCSFEVLEAEDKLSQSNNEMIKLKLECTTILHKKLNVYDFLVSTVKWKLATFLSTIDAKDIAEKGEVSASELIGKTGYCKCEKDGDFYKIKRYISKNQFDNERVKQSQSMRNDTPENPPFEDDDLPF